MQAEILNELLDDRETQLQSGLDAAKASIVEDPKAGWKELKAKLNEMPEQEAADLVQKMKEDVESEREDIERLNRS